MRAQIIEAITLISSSITEDVFIQFSNQIVEVMILMQKQQMDETDPQRSYLLSAW